MLKLSDSLEKDIHNLTIAEVTKIYMEVIQDLVTIGGYMILGWLLYKLMMVCKTIL